MIGDTDLISAVKDLVHQSRSSAGTTIDTVKTIVSERASTVNIQGSGGQTALHHACSPVSRYYRCREEIVLMLLNAGANPFLLDDNGNNCLQFSSDARDREALIGILLRHRLEVEPQIDSVAPLSASRLMKRSQDDRGFGLFSTVAPTCLYYLYKGAIYLWETVQDVEHVVYQPRATVRDLQETETKLESHRRRKSYIARGGEDPDFEHTDEENLLAEISRLEKSVTFVTHFTIVSGLDAQQTNIPQSGCTEWIITDIGVMVSVQMNTKGIVVGRGTSSFAVPAGRRKSHVCGAAATYETGMGPKVQVYDKGGVHFFRQPKEEPASHVCCAFDGIRGVGAYVMCKKPARAASESPPQSGMTSFSNKPPTLKSPGMFLAAYDDPFASGSPHSSVKFSTSAGADGGGIEGAGDSWAASASPRSIGGNSPPPSNTISFISFASATSQQEKKQHDVPIYQPCDDDKLVFRVLNCDMAPKDGLNGVMRGLCSRWSPFSGVGVDEKFLPADTMPISVQQLGRTKFVLFTSAGPIMAETASTPTVFHTIASNPQGPVVYGVAKPAPRTPRLRTVLKRCILVQVSEVVEVIEVHHETCEVTPLLRTAGDRISPHRIIPVFHPIEDSLILLYQSNKRQEMVRFDFGTSRMQCVCRLPKPSSLRFYHSSEEQALSELWFAFNKTGEQLLRYNVSMHVMSIYSWDEMLEEGAKQYHNFSQVRNPVTINFSTERNVIQEVKVTGDGCTWIVVEAQNIPTDLSSATEHSLRSTIESTVRRVTKAVGGSRFQVLHGDRWASAVPVPLDALRGAVRVLRALIDAEWSESILQHDAFAPQMLEYRAKTAIQKIKGMEPLEDDAAVKYLKRGPLVRVFLRAGFVNDDPVSAIAPVSQVITNDTKGLIAIDSEVMKIVRPLLPFAAISPLATAHIGRVTVAVPQELDARLAW